MSPASYQVSLFMLPSTAVPEPSRQLWGKLRGKKEMTTYSLVLDQKRLGWDLSFIWAAIPAFLLVFLLHYFAIKQIHSSPTVQKPTTSTNISPVRFTYCAILCNNKFPCWLPTSCIHQTLPTSCFKSLVFDLTCSYWTLGIHLIHFAVP